MDEDAFIAERASITLHSRCQNTYRMDASSQDRKNFLQSSERAAQFNRKIYTDSIGCPTDDTRVELKSVSFIERGTNKGEDPYSNVKISLFESESPSLSHHSNYLPQRLTFPSTL